MSRNKLYSIFGSLTAAGYAWLLLNTLPDSSDTSVCVFKNVTGVPCPSCGSTRSAVLILNGDLTGGAMTNPLGFIVILALAVVPLWLLKDVLLKQNSFYKFYIRAEHLLRKKHIGLPSIALILINWIWNVFKQ